MNNSPNMVHCQFENTARALDQLIATMEAARSMRDLDLNQYERSAFARLPDQCETLRGLIEDLENSGEFTDDELIDGVTKREISQRDLTELGRPELRVVRDEADERFNKDIDGEHAGYFEDLMGAAENVLQERLELTT